MRRLIRSLAALGVLAWACAAPAQDNDPAEVYKKFHAAALASNFEELNRWGTESGSKEIQAMPSAQRDAVLKFMAALLPKSYSVTRSAVDTAQTRAVLYAIGTNTQGERVNGTIVVLKERGAWKVDKADWASDGPPSFPAAKGQAPRTQKVAAQEPKTPFTEAPPAADKPAEKPAAKAPARPSRAAKAAPREGAKKESSPPELPPLTDPVAREQARVPECIIRPVMTDAEIERCRPSR